MDDPNEENIESSWVMVNTIDLAEEATTLNYNENLEVDKVDKNNDSVESDIDSDGISIISESSHLNESNNEDVTNDKYEKTSDNDAVLKLISINDQIATECASQLKSNWTFVGSETRPPEMAASNQFYLNCLQEPIQELSEHELGSVQSDLESDGISIISDCESLNDFTDDEKKLSQDILTKENCDNERLELASKLPPGIKKYCNGVLIGTILLATSSIFLGHYFNSVEPIEEELPIYKEEYKSELKENVADNINEKYEVPTALAYCQERHKSDDVFTEHNVNKCLNQIENRMKRKKESQLKKQEIKKFEKYLKIKEQYLEDKEQFLIKREYELLKVELKLKQENFKKTKNGKEDLEELKKNTNEKLNNLKAAEHVENEAKMIIKEKHKKYKEKRHKVVKDKVRYKKYNINHLQKNKKDKSFAAHLENMDDVWKHKKETFSSYNLNKIEKHKKKIKNKKENMPRNENNLIDENYKNKKIIENLQFSNSEDNKYDKVKERKIGGSTNYIILENGRDNQTISGYWVGKLYKGRNDMRNKKHGGDWYFDRASYRKTKRDKAKWYFDWMMDREVLRYKRSFYI